jgi:hypothetical protein
MNNPAGLDRECPCELIMLARWLDCDDDCGMVGTTDGSSHDYPTTSDAGARLPSINVQQSSQYGGDGNTSLMECEAPPAGD